MIRFACPCGRELQAREEDIGREAKCPVCDAVSVVPDASTPVPPPAAIQADTPERPRRERRREDSEDRPRRRRESEPVATDTSGKAITALVLGILSPFLLLPCIPGAIFGILALRDIGRSKGRLGGNGMAIAGLVLSCISVVLLCPAVMIGMLLPAVQNVREAAQRMKDSNNLKQLAIGLISHESAHGSFPQAAAYQDANGKPLLSWRVAILPYIGEAQLYSRFRLDEPWDSPNNKALLPMMPMVFGLPGDTNLSTGMTHYQVFVGPGTAFEPRKRGEQPPGAAIPGTRMADFTDGTSNTILVATSATTVPWTKPDDMPFDPAGPLPPMGGYLARGTNAVALADGSVRSLLKGTPDATIRAAITRNGNEIFLWP